MINFTHVKTIPTMVFAEITQRFSFRGFELTFVNCYTKKSILRTHVIIAH